MGLKLMYADRHVSRLSAKRVTVVWHVSRLSAKRGTVVWRVSRLSTKFYGGFVL